MATKEDGGDSKEVKLGTKIVNISLIRNAKIINDLLNEHGEVYVTNPHGLPIKITFATLG